MWVLSISNYLVNHDFKNLNFVNKLKKFHHLKCLNTGDNLYVQLVLLKFRSVKNIEIALKL